MDIETVLKDLFESSALLRLRIATLHPEMKEFGEFKRHKLAMVEADKMLYPEKYVIKEFAKKLEPVDMTPEQYKACDAAAGKAMMEGEPVSMISTPCAARPAGTFVTIQRGVSEEENTFGDLVEPAPVQVMMPEDSVTMIVGDQFKTPMSALAIASDESMAREEERQSAFGNFVKPPPVVCHQKKVKLSTEAEDKSSHPELFDRAISEYVFACEVMSRELCDFVKRYEWMGSMGVSPRWCFTARIDGTLAGVVALNLPNAFSKILGPDTTKDVECLIQRGASASFAHPHLGSKLIMWSVRWMVANTNKRVFYGYSDPRAGERGVIYSACNFVFMGSKFGATAMYSHPSWKAGKPFSPQSLRRTSILKQWMRREGIPWLPEYAKANGFKDLSVIPVEIKNRWYRWGDQIVAESIKDPIPTKGKWVMILGRDKRETRELRRLSGLNFKQ